MTAPRHVRPLLAALRGYQRWISPLLPPACRYHPTCSAYAIDALRHHGVLRGGWLATRRLCRCHPWGGSGYDPVPGVDVPATAVAPDAGPAHTAPAPPPG